MDSTGNLFIADTGNGSIRRFSPNGIITTVAGNGTVGYSGDGGPASDAQLNLPAGMALDSASNLFIADHWAVRKVSASGIIATVAGNGMLSGSSADGGPATSATLVPLGIAVDTAGNLFIADRYNWRVRKVTTSGIITTVAGNGVAGVSSDGGPATSAQLRTYGVAVDGAGTVFSTDPEGHMRKVSASGIISTVRERGRWAATQRFQVMAARPPARKSALHEAWRQTVQATCSSRITATTAFAGSRLAGTSQRSQGPEQEASLVMADQLPARYSTTRLALQWMAR